MTEIVNVRRFRKKPVEFEAVHWLGTAIEATSVIRWVLANGGTARYHEAGEKIAGPGRGLTTLPEYIAVDTLDATARVFPGDWLVKGIKDEFYPIKDDILHNTAEEINL